MNRLLTYYWVLKSRPFGAVVVAVALGSFFVACVLAISTFLDALRPYGLAVAIVYGLLLLTLAVSLFSSTRAKLNDVHDAITLESGLRRAGYAPDDFFTDQAAANPSLQLLHFKILRLLKPKRVLELGSGQTTKLLSCYKLQNPDSYVLSIEQDGQWFRQFGPKLATTWYKDLPEFHGKPFDYLLVDGPDHGGLGTDYTPYARSGLLDYVPSILAPAFIVVFDDAERYGESMTINAMAAILRAHSIPFIRFTRQGVKTQVVLCSTEFAFLRSI
jgi:hypothetical protein